MLAALLIEPGRIVIDDVDELEVAPGEVCIAVAGVGLCGSDLAVFQGKWAAPHYPWIMGHEAFGTIEAVGTGVDAGRVGEWVVVEPNIACLRCPSCRRGRTSACPQRRSLGMNRPGALAERVVVPAHLAWRVEPLAPRDLACVEPLAVVETALHRLPQPLPADVLVVGVGAQGLLMSLALRRRGLRAWVTDVNAERVAFATHELGAAAVEPDDGRRFELVVDTSGTPAAVAESVRRSEVGATILELGLERRPFEISAETLVRQQLILRGSLTYDHPDGFARAVELVRTKAVAPGRVISDEHPFEAAQLAFEGSARARGKTWIRMSPPA